MRTIAMAAEDPGESRGPEETQGAEASQGSRPLRSHRLLLKKFRQYLLPSLALSASGSLYEILDSLIASRLLGADAMVVIKMGAPLMLMTSAVYVLLGCGGATLYAVSLGNRDHEKAGSCLTASMTAAAAAGLLLLAAGRLLFRPLAELLCRNPDLAESFRCYLSVELFSLPVLILVLTLAEFLPPAGYPGLATAVSILANGTNIAMDYVLLRFFHMGVEGTALATILGYLAGAALLTVSLLSGKVTLCASTGLRQSLRLLWKIGKKGSPDALTQTGYSLKYAVCNAVAMACAGTAGMVGYSLVTQAIAMVSVYLTALINASVPLLAVLHGERDYRGEAGVLQAVLFLQFAVTAVSMGLLALFAPQIAILYNISEPEQLRMAVHALRIYTLSLPARNAAVIYFRYLNVIGLETYAAVVSAMDGMVLILPAVLLLSRLWGIEGLWWAYPVVSVLIVLIILLYNCRIRTKSQGRYSGPLLTEADRSAEPLLDVTITEDAASIAGISAVLQEACERAGLDRNNAVRAAVALEELAVYAADQKNQDTYMDVLVRLYQGNIEIDFRSLGPLYHPGRDDMDNTDGREDREENLRLLRGIADSLENEYILGMNCTRMIIKDRSSL